MSEWFEQKIQNINVAIKKGNVATEDVDCVVVPEFKSGSSRGGVGYAIEAEGMSKGLDAYDEIAKNKTVEYGDAVITESGKAGVKLAHVTTAGADDEEQLGVVQEAVLNTLLSADKQGLKKIAVPELGTGIIGSLTQEQAAQAIFNAVHVFSKDHPNSSIKELSLVVYRGSTAPAEKVLADKSYLEFDSKRAGQKEFDTAAWIEGMRQMIDGHGEKSKNSNDTKSEQVKHKTSSIEQFHIEQSFTFQDKVEESGEYPDILKYVQNKMRITIMHKKLAANISPLDFSREVIEESSQDYQHASSRTKRAVSDEFYKRHAHKLDDVLGKENLETIKRFEEKNEFTDYIKLDEFTSDREGYIGFVYGTSFGSGGTVGFVGELCHGHKPKEGDKILLAENFMEDAEFGKIEKTDAFVYENGKYKHFYQEYSPLRDDNTVEKIVEVTKAMQQKTQGTATRDGLER